MTSVVHLAPAACIDPDLGARATQAQGRPCAPPVAAHLTACLACRIQRAAFEKLDERAVATSPELRAWLRTRACELVSRSPR